MSQAPAAPRPERPVPPDRGGPTGALPADAGALAPPQRDRSGQRPGRARRGIGRRVAVLVAVLAALVGVAAPAGALLTGVDVASWQHPTNQPINWAQVRGAGHSFAFVKATEATNYRNPWFAQDFAGAGNAGLYRGAYHYAKPALPMSSAVDQARWFVSTTGSMGGPLDLGAVLDLEETGGLTPVELAQWTRTWLNEVERLTGRLPIVYTGYYFWRDSVGNPTDIGSRYRLWLPSYPADPNSTTFRPLVPAGWATWTYWQYTSTGAVPGIVGNVDLNRFCCDPGSLAALAGGGGAAGNPFGTFEGATRVPAGAQVSGWAIDPDSTDPIPVHFYADGAYAGSTTASARRTDVGAAYRGFGDAHGIAGTIPVPAGARQLCAYAINVGSGSGNPLLGCSALDGNPIGTMEGAWVDDAGVVRASGWALDPDTTGPLDVHVYVSNRWGQAVRTTQVRNDVQAAYPGTGPTQGWSAAFGGLPPGAHRVCAFAINVANGTTNPMIGCHDVSLPPLDPVGNVEAATPTTGGVRLQGWALDFDSPNPIDVHVYVDGAFAQVARADGARADVGAFLKTSGRHGYDVTVRTGGGRHTVCAFAINVLRGSTNSLLGCRVVDVGANPVGNLEGVARSGGTATVSGWALDPDAQGPVDVHVYVNGGWGGIVAAGSSRPDVGAIYPWNGPVHGFALSVGVGAAPATVCALAINLGPGSAHTLLGCRAV
jgi:GH25 family lysozyme M1 (1,4-beta-N-acetylmuramidase)